MVNGRHLATVLMRPLNTLVSSQCLWCWCIWPACDWAGGISTQNKINIWESIFFHPLEPDICTTAPLLHRYVQRGEWGTGVSPPCGHAPVRVNIPVSSSRLERTAWLESQKSLEREGGTCVLVCDRLQCQTVTHYKYIPPGVLRAAAKQAVRVVQEGFSWRPRGYHWAILLHCYPLLSLFSTIKSP